MAGDLVIYSNAADPAPKAAFETLVKDFETANPDIKVKLTLFDAENYKTTIRNFLSAEAPDVANWYAGNRMKPFVDGGLLEPVDDVWAENKLDDQLKSAAASMTVDGKKWGVPYTYYQWGIYYRKDIFNQLGIAEPRTWEEFKAAGAKLKANGVTPLTIGTKFPWTTAGVFDYLDLRTNGFDFHNDLTAGKIAWTDERVRKTFANWKELLDAGFFIENHTAYGWQEALAPMIQGTAAMYLMAHFCVPPLREAGITGDKLGFFQFPEISPDIPMAEDAPTDSLHIPARAKNKTDAKKFLAYVARPDVQTRLNAGLGQLPVNSGSTVADDPFLQAGFKMLANAAGLAQFFDRDSPPEIAQAGTEAFQEFMVKPDRLDALLERMERVRKKAY
ncbi:ABC transporter substrate-binding protein [Mesorhizobium australafricanum]|uniref:Extracellular solute-binding protein n=1 Tax=Mesorhizobium australafricanum TaxID=3072311 RepID=A0ABU4X1Z3_9HYPH|nr:extracellular solute-binding protein [Mesorhizobium sp. VK3E]MDX8442336.1 extracellular solute-binding protein [Mesorhizobium sp. VK3E]